MARNRHTRGQVFDVIETELNYQDRRWNADTTSTEGQHSVSEFVLFMDDYLRETKTMLSRNGEPGASEMALHNIRKIVAMGVSCMMQNGAPVRG